MAPGPRRCNGGAGAQPLGLKHVKFLHVEIENLSLLDANPTEVILAESEQGRGILGVVDGFLPKGVEDAGEIKWRKDFLRKIGYKL